MVQAKLVILGGVELTRRVIEAETDERKVSKQNLPLSTFKIFEISQSEE